MVHCVVIILFGRYSHSTKKSNIIEKKVLLPEILLETLKIDVFLSNLRIIDYTTFTFNSSESELLTFSFKETTTPAPTTTTQYSWTHHPQLCQNLDLGKKTKKLTFFIIFNIYLHLR